MTENSVVTVQSGLTPQVRLRSWMCGNRLYFTSVNRAGTRPQGLRKGGLELGLEANLPI